MLGAAIAALCACGVVVLLLGVHRLNQRAATARRVAEMLQERPPLRVCKALWRRLLSSLHHRNSVKQPFRNLRPLKFWFVDFE